MLVDISLICFAEVDHAQIAKNTQHNDSPAIMNDHVLTWLLRLLRPLLLRSWLFAPLLVEPVPLSAPFFRLRKREPFGIPVPGIRETRPMFGESPGARSYRVARTAR